MNRQTVEQAMSMLNILQQPGFCIRQNGTLVHNEPAKLLVPSCSAALAQWLGNANAIYKLWDRSSSLQITVTVQNQDYHVAVHPLRDGTLFLMTQYEITSEVEASLSATSQVLRQPLSELCALLQKSEQAGTLDQPSFSRLLYQMTRVVSNLTDIGRLNAPAPRLRISQTTLQEFFSKLLDEVKTLCESAGREFSYSFTQNNCDFTGDMNLLQRAILNLISNALKFSPPGTPISCRTEFIGTHLLCQIENACTDNGAELLRSAFSRLSHRGNIPSPQWGVGLGLPIANAIARLHGGMVAVETHNGKATVTFSFALHKQDTNVVSSPISIDYSGGMRQTLLELSDALPSEVFQSGNHK